MCQFDKTLQQMLKFILIIGLAFFHAIALIYTLLIWKPDPKIPFIFLCLSATLFSCLCVDLARDQLQNIAYYPVTNALFLLTFTLCCIISSMHSLSKNITKYWPLIQLIAFIIYILHEEYIIRQILYRILQLDNSLKGFMLVICGLVSCVIAHFGCGTVIKLLLEGRDKQLRNINQEIQSMIKADSFYNNEQNFSHNIYRDAQIAHIQQKNYLQTLISQNKQLPQILKASLILGPPLLDLFSYILQFFSAQTNHNHFHKHIHHYFSEQGSYFQDLTSQSVIGMFFFAIRIISSAIVFHTIYKIWSRQIDKIGKSLMKEKYNLAVLGFGIAVGRMLAQRM